MRRSVLEALGAILAVVGAVGCLALAFDAIRLERALADDDIRFQVKPRATDLWSVDGVLPAAPLRALLRLDDDLEFREAAHAYTQARPGAVEDYDPRLPLLRMQAQRLLTELTNRDADASRRSRALNLLGVLMLGQERASNEEERRFIFSRAVGLFQNAVDEDPDNAVAKYNLEQALRAGGLLLPGDDPGRGGDRGAGTASQREGEGY